MHLLRQPSLILRPFVRMLWASEGGREVENARERVLPTGAMHLVIRLSDTPLRLFDHLSGESRVIGHSIVGAARSSFYVRDVSRKIRSVGAQLHPGVAAMVLGVPGGALAERHTSLDDLWGRAAESARDRIGEEETLAGQLDVFESILIARVASRLHARAVHPAVLAALSRFSSTDASVRMVACETGYSHRHFIELFREAVGLSPKTFCRIIRFQRAIALAARSEAPWSAIAHEAGYGDQSHLHRDFTAFAGLSPGRYRTLAPTAGNHVAIR